MISDGGAWPSSIYRPSIVFLFLLYPIRKPGFRLITTRWHTLNLFTNIRLSAHFLFYSLVSYFQFPSFHPNRLASESLHRCIGTRLHTDAVWALARPMSYRNNYS